LALKVFFSVHSIPRVEELEARMKKIEILENFQTPLDKQHIPEKNNIQNLDVFQTFLQQLNKNVYNENQHLHYSPTPSQMYSNPNLGNIHGLVAFEYSNQQDFKPNPTNSDLNCSTCPTYGRLYNTSKYSFISLVLKN